MDDVSKIKQRDQALGYFLRGLLLIAFGMGFFALAMAMFIAPWIQHDDAGGKVAGIVIGLIAIISRPQQIMAD